MNLRYILAAGILVAGISAQAAMTQRSAAVGELAAYCAPQEFDKIFKKNN